MTVLVWIFLGLVSGIIASKIVNRSGRGFVTDMALGIVGALIGGWLFNTFGMPAGVGGLSLYGSIVVIAGAVAVLMAHHFLVRNAQ
jgi:uncharacterized membrane protein YeaQ/YmgE (transglycosylase-associated protein family)